MRLLTVGVVGSLLVIAAVAMAEETPPANEASPSEPKTTSDGPTGSEATTSSETGSSSGADTDSSRASSDPAAQESRTETQASTPTEICVLSCHTASESKTTVTIDTDSGKIEIGEEETDAAAEDAPTESTDAQEPSTYHYESPPPRQASAAEEEPGETSEPEKSPLAIVAEQALPLLPVETLPIQLPVLRPIELPRLDILPASDAPETEEAPDRAFVGPVQMEPSTTVAQEMKVDPVAAIVAATLVLGATATATAWGSATWQKFLPRLARWVGLGFLFTRLSDDDLLNHPRRNEIHEYVLQNPGERLETVRRALNLSNGSMLHHVRILHARNLVRMVRDGAMTRLYPAGPRIQPEPYVPAARRRLLELVNASPGCTQREIAERFGASERMVSYHLGQLRASGLVDVRRDGTAKRCFPLQRAVSA